MKKTNSVWYFACLMLITSCSSNSFLYESDTTKEDGIAIHGNFCGKNIPTIETEIMEERVSILQSIRPIDSVDSACKQHDICYAEQGYYSKKCDKELIDRVTALGDSGSNNCQFIKDSIVSYFKTTNPSYVKNINKEGDIFKKGFTPFEYVIDTAILGLSATGAALVKNDLNSDGKISLAEILESRKNDTKSIRKQKRYEECN